jgi:DNA uptake protein ComE-like DNA-binding protein
MYRLVTALALPALLLAACEPAPGPMDITAATAAQLTPAEQARVVDLLNDPGSDLALLHKVVAIDIRAARAIVAYRSGPDGALPTADDVYFPDIAAVDALPYVGPVALTRLAAYALTRPAPAGETVETVVFRGWEAQAVVFGVNQATQADLAAFLDDRAAAALVAGRPFASVTAMGPVRYVGTVALKALRAHAPGWFATQHGQTILSGTYDGVTFDEATARTALAIANGATVAQLTAHGVTAAPAAAIFGARPYTTLAQVAAVSGVGTATMTALRTYAQSGAWAPDCVAAFDSAVRPHLADLLFMSESDRPLEIVSFRGQGATAPTADSVLALAGVPAGSTAEARDPANFLSNLEPASSTADPGAVAAVQAAIAAQLTDVAYVALHLPPTPEDPYSCDVVVYLVGRTTCGDLVGLKSIAVET